MSQAAVQPRVGISRTLRRAQGEDESAPKRVGRPTDYDPFMVAEAAGMLQMGATDLEVCEAIGISSATFYRWMHTVPGFREAVQNSKVANTRVEQALYSRAVGIAKKRTVTTEPDGKVTERVEELPPDPRAQAIWLHNRNPDRWKQRTEHQLVVPVDDTPALPAEEQDVRKLALAAIALMREAGDAAPLIEQTGIEPMPDDVSYDDEDEEIEDDERDEDFDI